MIGNASGVDMLRVLVMLMGAANIAMGLVVVAIYARSWWLVTRGPKVHWIGLLPGHVTLVGLAFMTMVLASMANLIDRTHDGFSWRIPVYGFAFGAGMIAMWLILGHSRHRLRSITEGAIL